MVKLTIDKQELEVTEGTTILEAAKQAGIHIPTLCFNKHLKPYGGCRVCIVELVYGNGRSRVVSSCSYKAEEGLNVVTDSDRVKNGRRFIIELLLARNANSDALKELAAEYGLVPGDVSTYNIIDRFLLNGRTTNVHTKCILCAQCIRACAEIPQRHALTYKQRGIKRRVTPPFEKYAHSCIGCGSCSYVCPTGAVSIVEAS